MGELLRYFRQHPWHRRLITLSLAGILGMVVALVGYPYLRNWRAIEALSDPDPAKRAKAIEQAVWMAREFDDFREDLEEALDTGDDERFATIAEVLDKAELFRVEGRCPEQLDRFERILFARSQPRGGATTATSAPSESARELELDRREVVHEFILRDRSEAETLKLLVLAAADPAACVRRKAALLAAKLGHTASIEALLADPVPTVRAWVMIDLALAGRSAFTEQVARRLAGADDPGELSCAAWALAKLDPARAAAAVAGKIAATPPGALQDRLLWVATMLPPESIGPAVVEAAASASAAGAPLRMPILASVRLMPGDRRVRQLVEKVLKVADGEDVLRRRGELAVAAWATRQLGLPAVEALNTLLRAGFARETSLVMTETALSLGELAPAAPPMVRHLVVGTLGRAVADPRSALASAAAAVAAWRIDPAAGRPLVIAAAKQKSRLASDWLAWHMAERAGEDAAAVEGLAIELLGVPYSNDAKAAGVAMLALAARGTERQADALAVLAHRFGPDENPYPRDGVLQESYRCALLLLGQTRHAPGLERVLAERQFPHRRVLTALLLTSSRYGADWLLGRDERTAEAISGLLGSKTIGEVLGAARPDLPPYEYLAAFDVRVWQADIIRDAYLLSR